MEKLCRLMIIDDEFIMRQGLKNMVDWEAEGFLIAGEGSNGEEGLRLIEEARPHIILCDIVMPVMDGMEFGDIVHKRYPEIQIIMLSSYDNFEYVKGTLLNGAVDYILKPALNPQNLLETLNKYADRIPGLHRRKSRRSGIHHHMERYLLGFDSGEDTEKWREELPHAFYRILGANIKKTNGEGHDLTLALYQTAVDYVNSFSGCACVPLLIREEILCIILNYNVSVRPEIEKSCYGFSEKLMFLYPAIFCVLSEEVTRVQDLKEIYHSQLLPEVDKAFYFKDIHLRILRRKEETETPGARFDFHHFTSLLNSGHFGTALTLLEEYTGYALKGRMEEDRIKNQVKNMLYNLLDNMGFSHEEMSQKRYEYFKRLDRTRYRDEFEITLHEISQEILTNMKEQKASPEIRIRKMIAYIEENYKENLDLKEIAEVFNFNYYYLSSYFSQHMPEGFSGYLNRLRIREAEMLLRGNELSISQISSAVGYSDHSYFCRVFKKITGNTPSAWRRENRLGRS